MFGPWGCAVNGVLRVHCVVWGANLCLLLSSGACMTSATQNASSETRFAEENGSNSSKRKKKLAGQAAVSPCSHIGIERGEDNILLGLVKVFRTYFWVGYVFAKARQCKCDCVWKYAFIHVCLSILMYMCMCVRMLSKCCVCLANSFMEGCFQQCWQASGHDINSQLESLLT